MMIDIEQQTTCKACGKPLTQKSGKGHRARVFCNKACKQVDYRRRHPIISNVTIESDRNVPLEREDQAQRIAQLEQENAALQEQINIEQRYRTDYQVRHFKSWLRKHPQAQDTDFAKRFIADTRLPEHASRGLYGAHLRLYKYSETDLYLFQEAWKDMMFTQT